MRNYESALQSSKWLGLFRFARPLSICTHISHFELYSTL